MSYAFTARPPYRDDATVTLINGGMEQRGFPWAPTLGYGWPRAVADEVAALALIDNAYCLDAPTNIPAGACYGSDSLDGEFAMAIQRAIPRSEHP